LVQRRAKIGSDKVEMQILNIGHFSDSYHDKCAYGGDYDQYHDKYGNVSLLWRQQRHLFNCHVRQTSGTFKPYSYIEISQYYLAVN
jgi:hypothetical protein